MHRHVSIRDGKQDVRREGCAPTDLQAILRTLMKLSESLSLSLLRSVGFRSRRWDGRIQAPKTTFTRPTTTHSTFSARTCFRLVLSSPCLSWIARSFEALDSSQQGWRGALKVRPRTTAIPISHVSDTRARTISRATFRRWRLHHTPLQHHHELQRGV